MWIYVYAQYDSKTTEHFQSVKVGRLKPHRKHRSRYETVAKIQDKQVAKIWSKDNV